jgi:hypothetical protein
MALAPPSLDQARSWYRQVVRVRNRPARAAAPALAENPPRLAATWPAWRGGNAAAPASMMRRGASSRVIPSTLKIDSPGRRSVTAKPSWPGVTGLTRPSLQPLCRYRWPVKPGHGVCRASAVRQHLGRSVSQHAVPESRIRVDMDHLDALVAEQLYTLRLPGATFRKPAYPFAIGSNGAERHVQRPEAK